MERLKADSDSVDLDDLANITFEELDMDIDEIDKHEDDGEFIKNAKDIIEKEKM